MDELNEFLWLVFQAVIFSGLSITAILSLWALCAPASFLQFEKRVNTVSAIDLSLLDKPYDLDWFVYRHHVLIGVIISLLSVATLFLMVFSFDRHTFEFTSWLGDGFWLHFVADIFLGMAYFLVVLALYAGSIILIRPSALKKIEIWANRCFSPNLFGQKAGEVCETPNRWVESHPRLFGGVIFFCVITITFIVISLRLY